jgi:hypothetical protein
MSCIVPAMKPQKFVRPCRADERTMLESGCRALAALTVRRCQRLLASAEGLAPATMASQQRCARPTGHHVLEAFAERGLDCLRHGSHVPPTRGTGVDGRDTGATPGAPASKPAQLGQGATPLDLATAGRRRSRARAQGPPPVAADAAGCGGPLGCKVETGHALDGQARSRRRTTKTRRDRLLHLAEQPTDSALGFEEEVRGSREAPPRRHSWCEDAP